MKHFGILALLVVAFAMLCDAKVIVPVTRDDASDAYIDQVFNFYVITVDKNIFFLHPSRS